MRLAGVFNDLEDQAESEHRARAREEAVKRIAELSKERGDRAASRITFLLGRGIGSRGRHPSEDPIYATCYFNFPKGDRTYNSGVSLQFANGGRAQFQLNMLGGQDNRISELGAVDFASIVKAPGENVTAKWAREGKAKVGHVYIEHCFSPEDRVNMTVKFKVLDLKAIDWVIIEWQPIPQEGKERS